MVMMQEELSLTSWITYRVMALLVAASLPVSVSWADGTTKKKKPAEPAKKHVKTKESPKYDVIVAGVHGPKDQRKPARPIAIVLAFADGSTQKVDISKYRRITIDGDRQQVLLHSGDLKAPFAPASHGHAPGPAAVRIASPPHGPGSKPTPVRIPLKAGVLPKQAHVDVKLAFDHAKPPNKAKQPKPSPAKKAHPIQKTAETDKRRLERLEKMLKKLEQEVRLLKDKAVKPTNQPKK